MEPSGWKKKQVTYFSECIKTSKNSIAFFAYLAYLGFKTTLNTKTENRHRRASNFHHYCLDNSPLLIHQEQFFFFPLIKFSNKCHFGLETFGNIFSPPFECILICALSGLTSWPSPEVKVQLINGIVRKPPKTFRGIGLLRVGSQISPVFVFLFSSLITVLNKSLISHRELYFHKQRKSS